MKRLYEGEIVFVKSDHTYYVNWEGKDQEMPSLSSVLKRSGLSPVYSGEIHPSVLEKAARRGDAVHAATHALLEGRDWEVDPAHTDYMERAKRLIGVHKMQVEYAEKPLFNPVFEYCCTPDFVGYVDGKPAIVDWKTTSRVHFQAGFQVAGQALCFREPDMFDLYVGDLTKGTLRPFASEKYLRVTRHALATYNEVLEIEEEET